jgi:hypothetical protein
MPGKRLQAHPFLLDSSPIMMIQLPVRQAFARIVRCAPCRAVGLVIGALLVTVAGCTDTEPDLPPARIETVEAYGVKLDASASPRDVAYVLLRTLADDVNSAQAGEQEKHKEALIRAYRLAAYDTISQRLEEVMKQAGQPNPRLDEERERKLYEFTSQWGAIVAHYVRSFDTDRQAAFDHMRLVPGTKPDQAIILYNVSHDPAETNPERQERATLRIELARETAGGESYWRVARLDYELPTPPTVLQATTTTAPG